MLMSGEIAKKGSDLAFAAYNSARANVMSRTFPVECTAPLYARTSALPCSTQPAPRYCYSLHRFGAMRTVKRGDTSIMTKHARSTAPQRVGIVGLFLLFNL